MSLHNINPPRDQSLESQRDFSSAPLGKSVRRVDAASIINVANHQTRIREGANLMCQPVRLGRLK